MAFALPTEVPVIDLACTHCDLSTEVGAALRRFGFFYVRHHGVPDLLIAKQFEQSKRLFDLPAATKAGLTFNATLDIGHTGGSGVIRSGDPAVLSRRERISSVSLSFSSSSASQRA